MQARHFQYTVAFRTDCDATRPKTAGLWPLASYEAFSSSGAPGSPTGGQTAAAESARNALNLKENGMKHRQRHRHAVCR